MGRPGDVRLRRRSARRRAPDPRAKGLTLAHVPAPPADDLYARLGLTATATTGQIETAWRELMKLHHPDVAGPLSTRLAQRINVARDWLCDPERRARYDASPSGRAARLRRGPASPTSGPAHGVSARPRPAASRVATARRLARFDPWTADFGPETATVRTFLATVAALRPEQIARLAAGPKVALVDAIPSFVDDERRLQLARVEAALAAIVPAERRRDPVVVSAVLGRAFALALADLLDPDELVAHLLSDAWRTAIDEPVAAGSD